MLLLLLVEVLVIEAVRELEEDTAELLVALTVLDSELARAEEEVRADVVTWFEFDEIDDNEVWEVVEGELFIK